MSQAYYEVGKNGQFPDVWHVESVLGDGSIEVAVFVGPESEARAKEYANWKNRPPADVVVMKAKLNEA